MRRFLFPIMAVILCSLLSPAVVRGEAEEGDVVSQATRGQEMIFARRYDDAMKLFEGLKRDYPDSPAGDFGVMAALEIEMLEREDFHREAEFLKAAKEGRDKATLVQSRYNPGTWDLFLSGSLMGLEGFFKARKGKWWDAYVAGTKSRQIFRRVKELDPSFVDADFGLGMYIYWRSVFAHDLTFLKMLPDRRKEGIEIVERVAEHGRFAKDLARMNLAVMYVEEGRFAEAQKICAEYVARFPSNVILRTILGKTLIALKRYDEAIAQFKAILSIDSSLKKPHYFIGAAEVLSGDPSRFAEAAHELRGFLGMESGRYWPASTHYWLGKLAEAKGDAAQARIEYDLAIALNPKAVEAQKRLRALGGGL
ncbi:MAG: tetratricopeptide repeat protein [Pseudomonadota bacterium]